MEYFGATGPKSAQESATTHPEFKDTTEALEVAAAFPESISGKTIIITGVNTRGIGFTEAEALASQGPKQLILTGRSLSKVNDSISALKARYPAVDYRALEIDLSKQKSVRAAAATVLSWTDVPIVDCLINSAGVFGVPERTITEDGLELHFATNHIGHFLFTCLIMPKLIAASQRSGTARGAVRVVNVSSGSPWMAQGLRWSDLLYEKINNTLPADEQPNYPMLKAWGYTNPEEVPYNPVEGYNQSKIANVLFGIALTEKVFAKHGILSLAVHPGVIHTELGRDIPPEVLDAVSKMEQAGYVVYKTVGAGASTSLVAALDPKLATIEKGVEGRQENYGAFIADCQVSEKCQPRNVSSSEAEKLWQLSEELVGEKFAW